MAHQPGSEDPFEDSLARRWVADFMDQYNREGLRDRSRRGRVYIVPDSFYAQYEGGGGSAQQQPDEEGDEEGDAVDTPTSDSEAVSPFQLSPIGAAISKGRIRDSLDLDKYKPPTQLGLRRTFSQQQQAQQQQAQQQQAQQQAQAKAPPSGAAEDQPAWDLPPTSGNIASFCTPPFLLPTKYRGHGYDAHDRASLRSGYDARDAPSHALNVMQPLAGPQANWWRWPVTAPAFPAAGPLPALWAPLRRHRRRHVTFADRPLGGVPMVRTRAVKPRDKASGVEATTEAAAEAEPKGSGVVDFLMDLLVCELRGDKAKKEAGGMVRQSTMADDEGKDQAKNSSSDDSSGVFQHSAMAEDGAIEQAEERGPPVGAEAGNTPNARRKLRKRAFRSGGH